MKKGIIEAGCLAVLSLLLAQSSTFAAEKLRFASSVSTSPIYYLPIMIALEKGFWKEEGLDVEYFPFRGGSPLYKAVSAAEIKMGIASAPSTIHAVSQGVPLTMVAQISGPTQFVFWVRAASPIRSAADIRGRKVGFASFGSLDHIYAQATAKALGVEREVRMVAVGGVVEAMAALRAGAIDALPMSPYGLMELEAKGQMRRVLRLADYLPKEWIEVAAFGSRDIVAARPDLVGKTIRGVVRALAFVRQNPDWVQDKLIAEHGYSREVAKRAYEILEFTEGGRISMAGLENAKKLLVDYGLVAREKAPATEALYTKRFTE